MAQDWIPYAIVLAFVAFILLTMYSWKHRKEIMAEVFPDQAEAKVKKHPKPRPGGKTNYHKH
jgi:hypothetical protein